MFKLHFNEVIIQWLLFLYIRFVAQFFHEAETVRKKSILQTKSRPLTVRIEKFHIIIQIIAAR